MLAIANAIFAATGKRLRKMPVNASVLMKRSPAVAASRRNRARDKKLIALVECGADPQNVLPRLKELEGERAHLQEQTKNVGNRVIKILPDLVGRYRTMRDLRAALAERSAEQKFEVAASIRNLVEKIVIYPSKHPQGRDLELVGQLAALLHKEAPRNGMRRVVAEDGFEPPTHGL